MLSLPISLLLAPLFLLSVHAAPAKSTECTLSFPNYSLIGRPAGEGACRYTVQYAQAGRWEDPTPTTDQTKHDTSNLPPACPQTPGGPLLIDAPYQNEQCLFGVIYAPRGLKRGDRLPVFVWVHGGSYYAGSASAPGLDGSTLATKGNMIVVVLQYRLGVLGLLPPSSSPTSDDPSLGVKDIILGLTQIQNYAEWIGGDRGKVTIGGQSSGASLIRALLAAPRAKGLSRAAILQSDPMTYGTASAETTTRLQQIFYAQPGLASCSTLDCLQRLPVDVLLLAQSRFIASAPGQVEGVPLVTRTSISPLLLPTADAPALRPTHYTPSIPSEPTAQTFGAAHTLPNSPAAVALLITTTANEAGQVVGSVFPGPIPADTGTYAQILSVFVNPARASAIVGSPEYALAGGGGDGDGLRETFERLVTDGVWRCVSRDFAARWAGQGGKVWVGEWTKGVGYVTNRGKGGYCASNGRVCHEDDIFPTFQSLPSPNEDTRSLQNEVLARWTAFIHNLDPNLPLQSPSVASGGTSGFAVPNLPGGVGSDRGAAAPPPSANCTRAASRSAGCLAKSRGQDAQPEARAAGSRWERYNGAPGQVYAIGGGEVKACPVAYWGQKVRYDWQLYP